MLIDERFFDLEDALNAILVDGESLKEVDNLCTSIKTFVNDYMTTYMERMNSVNNL